MLFLLSIISFSFANPSSNQTSNQNETITYIDFEEIDVNAELIKPSIIFIFPERQAAKPDLLIPDLRQLVLEKEAQKRNQ